jgi:hypothetical protein
LKAPVIIYKNLPALGMAIFPFILVKNKGLKDSAIIINHEKIHLRQQLELLILPFYLLYLISYIINLMKFKNHDKAYRNIIFEKEAYKNDDNLNYLKQGNWYGWLKFL